ncbi:MAG: 4a-hydroxytetrahydrobiopterin dehydratase [Candidatus Caenarcaniphilales bacterium]|nr:4a-hydroxytetrahydrobiopterin dehydratase [Candidatus Caenarcaniphilales bacterium]
MSKKLTPIEIEDFLVDFPEWSLSDSSTPAIKKLYRFKNYIDTITFVNKISQIAESLNHHPDLFVKYGSVEVNIHTHDQGGLTELDFEFARKADAL